LSFRFFMFCLLNSPLETTCSSGSREENGLISAVYYRLTIIKSISIVTNCS